MKILIEFKVFSSININESIILKKKRKEE